MTRLFEEKVPSQPFTMARSNRFYFHTHNKLHYFPIIASVTWFSTLTILLIRWLAVGRPRYPGQVNPDIPFISDIAAFICGQMKEEGIMSLQLPSPASTNSQ